MYCELSIYVVYLFYLGEYDVSICDIVFNIYFIEKYTVKKKLHNFSNYIIFLL